MSNTSASPRVEFIEKNASAAVVNALDHAPCNLHSAGPRSVPKPSVGDAAVWALASSSTAAMTPSAAFPTRGETE